MTQIFIIFVLRPPAQKSSDSPGLTGRHARRLLLLLRSLTLIATSFSAPSSFLGSEQSFVVVGRDGRMTVSFASRASLQSLQEGAHDENSKNLTAREQADDIDEGGGGESGGDNESVRGGPRHHASFGQAGFLPPPRVFSRPPRSAFTTGRFFLPRQTTRQGTQQRSTATLFSLVLLRSRPANPSCANGLREPRDS